MQWWARLAAVEKDYNEAFKHFQDVSRSQGPELAEGFAQGGSWYLEGVDFIQHATQDSGEQALDRIKEQLADLNSDK